MIFVIYVSFLVSMSQVKVRSFYVCQVITINISMCSGMNEINCLNPKELPVCSRGSVNMIEQ